MQGDVLVLAILSNVITLNVTSIDSRVYIDWFRDFNMHWSSVTVSYVNKIASVKISKELVQ